MVEKKSSRVNIMNYTYEIKNKNLKITEYDQWGYPECSWDLIDFSKKSLKFKSNWHEKSFLRTIKWLKENHPELLL